MPNHSNSILTERSEVPKIKEENQYQFLRYVIYSLGLSEEKIEPCFPETFTDFNLFNQQKLRDLLNLNSLFIVNGPEEEIKIFLEQDLIAQWFSPEIIWKADDKKIKSLYAQIKFRFWTSF